MEPNQKKLTPMEKLLGKEQESDVLGSLLDRLAVGAVSRFSKAAAAQLPTAATSIAELEHSGLDHGKARAKSLPFIEPQC